MADHNPAARVDLDALTEARMRLLRTLNRGVGEGDLSRDEAFAVLDAVDAFPALLAERDEARAERDALREKHAEAEWLLRMTYDARDRAERRVEAVEALLADPDVFPNPFGNAHAVLVSRLRATLADPEAS